VGTAGEGAGAAARAQQVRGQQVDTAPEAKAYADDYIGAHLEGIGNGKSYSEIPVPAVPAGSG